MGKGKLIKLIFTLLPLLFSLGTMGAEEDKRREVYVGVYLNNIAEIDPKTCKGLVDFDIWLKFEGDSTEAPQFIIQNIFEETIDYLHTIHEEETNWNLIRFKVRGTLSFKWDMLFYPFDKHKAHINIMLEDHEYEKWKLMPALTNSGISNLHSVADWDVYPALMVNLEEVKDKQIRLDQSDPLYSNKW